tara:strand:+ start:851 stop:1792 length:942 start_codon:yes stop_codon:yes gene_type:complete
MAAKISISKKLSSNHSGLRIDVLIAKEYPQYSRTHIKRWIEKGWLTLDGNTVRPSTKVKGNEIVKIKAEKEELTKDSPEKIPLDIIFEDKDLIILDKPSNLVVHPGAGNKTGTLVNGLLGYNEDLVSLPRAGIVHRLDKNTSGLLITAKNEITYLDLVKQIQQRSVIKKYLALVVGEPISGGRINTNIGRHPKFRTKQAVVEKGKEAITSYKIVKKYKGYSLLKVSILTGRTHQIRVHFSHMGYPIVGDKTYGGKSKYPKGISALLREKIDQFPRQALHASELEFIHPRTKQKVNFKISLPKDILELITFLKR